MVNNDDALVNVIKQSLNLKFGKSKKVIQDLLLKLVQEKRTYQNFNAENFYHGVAVGTKNVLVCVKILHKQQTV